MSEKPFGIKERAALLALMAAAREVSNPELVEMAGFDLTGKSRSRLADMKLIESRKVGRAFAHTLTDNGWAWCAKELSASVPARAGAAGGALYAVLAGLGDYLSRTDLRLADVFQPSTDTQVSAEDRIRSAYRKLRKEPRGWVALTHLRPPCLRA